MISTMKSMSDLFTRAGQQNCLILDNANLNIHDFKFFDYLKEGYQTIFNGEIGEFEFGYNQPGGGLNLKHLIAKHESHINHCEILEDDIVISGSGVTGILNSIFYLWRAQECSKVMVPTPVYSAIPFGIQYFGLELVEVSTDYNNEFIPTYSDFVSTFSNDVIGVILSNPGNPVCKYINKEDLINILKFCIEKDIYIIIDAIFEEAPGLQKTINHYFMWSNNYDKLIKIKGVSKDVPHMSDLRIGWSICKNKKLNDNLRYYNCMINYSNSRLAEHLIGIDYEERIKESTTDNYVNLERSSYNNLVIKSIATIVDYLRKQPLVSNVIMPDCGNIIYFKLDDILKENLHIDNSKNLAMWIMNEVNILFSPACYFFQETNELWLRLTLCYQVDTIIKALEKCFLHLTQACKQKQNGEER